MASLLTTKRTYGIQAARSKRRPERIVTCRMMGTKRYDNLLGAHALVWVGGWSKTECDKAVKGAAAAGYDLIELAVFQPENMDAAYTKSALQQAGVRASASLGLTVDADINSDDPEVVRRGKEKLLKALDFTHQVGGLYLCGVIASALLKYPAPATAEGRKNSAASLKEVARKAADYGITLGIEVVNRYETNLFNTAQEAMEFLALINEPNVKVHLDTFHMHIEENSLTQAVLTCRDKLGYVHIGESHRGYLGTGSVKFNELFKALAAVDYKGPLTFESFSSAVVSPDLSNTLCVWRNLWKDSSDLAVHARGFLHAEWTAALIAKHGA